MGSTRFRQTPWAAVRELGVLVGSFVPNSTSNPQASTVTGVGFTVTRTATSTWKVTFDKTYPSVPAAVATLECSVTTVDAYVRLVSVATTSATLMMRQSTTGIAIKTDVTKAAGYKINFCIFPKNTGTS